MLSWVKRVPVQDSGDAPSTSQNAVNREETQRDPSAQRGESSRTRAKTGAAGYRQKPSIIAVMRFFISQAKKRFLCSSGLR